jgi:Mn2+/Fe2+ NRAMP family transporter
VGRVTGRGLADNMRQILPHWLVSGLVGLLLINNVINLGADIGAMGQAAALVAGGRPTMYALGLALVSLLLETFVPFPRYSPWLKLMTLSLFAYVLTACIVDIPWRTLALQVWPQHVDHDYLITITAVLGTTISPYLFFWQASQEAEEEQADPDASPLLLVPAQAKDAFARIRTDTHIGMLYSNAVAFFIMLTAAAVLHLNGVTTIRTSADAAMALRPLAGQFAALLFSLGIIGTGLLAVPVLAGSAAYAVAEALGVRGGLGSKPAEARVFYAILGGATLLGTLITLSPIDPIRMLFWSAVINGVISVPLMAVIMWLSGRPSVMGEFTVRGPLRWLGWTATAIMAIAASGLIG